jgi:hypothetical protein
MRIKIEGQLFHIISKSFVDKEGKKIDYHQAILLIEGDDLVYIGIPSKELEKVQEFIGTKAVFEVELVYISGTKYKLTF